MYYWTSMLQGQYLEGFISLTCASSTTVDSLCFVNKEIHVHWRIFIHLNLSSLIWVINHLYLLVEGNQSSAVVSFYLLIICSAHQIHSIHNLHMSRYSDVISLHNSLTKVDILKLGLKMLVTYVCYCLPTNQNNFSGYTIFTFHLCNERLFVIGSIWCLWNQSNRSPTFSSYLCQGIV